MEWSSEHLVRAADSGSVAINPIIFAECAFGYVNSADLISDLPVGLELLPLPYEAAFLAGKAFATYRSLGGKRERILGDFYVGAHAEVSSLTLLTRDAGRYRTYFPNVKLIAPGMEKS